MAIHELKSWSEMFEAVISRAKPFEVRLNDRGFKVGDYLHLREWAPPDEIGREDHEPGEYTGREAIVVITYMLDTDNDWWARMLHDGYCLMTIEIIDVPDREEEYGAFLTKHCPDLLEEELVEIDNDGNVTPSKEPEPA
jgi:hypothetical protein